MIYKVLKIWKDKQIVDTFLIDVKRTFDHISQIELVQKIADLDIDINLIK